MNEDIIKLFVNMKKFQDDLVEQNIKYCDEIAELKKKLNEIEYYLNRVDIPAGYKDYIQDIINGE